MKDVLTVGVVSDLAGVTVRTLHHYDEIGLVVPAGRTDAGYRTYGPGEVERLQEVLFFRELGFGLDEIKAVMEDPNYSRTEALEKQRALLEQRADRLLRLMDAVDIAVLAERTGIKMSSEEMLDVFNEYEQEAKERWGHTEAYKQSAQRTSSYTKQDWNNIKAEVDGIYDSFLALMVDGVAADAPAAMAVAEQHRAHITRWFYECPLEVHAGLGQMYMDDERFQTNIDKAGDGLARYMSQAMAANAAK